ncbi:hypothetical protein INT44_007657 [Umbelopsis vinacea]|uniref:Uncharacterized protein n=1 Tax=Umbelopsis vinacea TaxID=44442 RepID=A0A8H7PJC6_9FUNG|nr:hypothetical protein INT44_007657 [Umbelopsis vinacea]
MLSSFHIHDKPVTAPAANFQLNLMLKHKTPIKFPSAWTNFAVKEKIIISDSVTMVTITPLISKALTSTAYDVKWIPHSARLCTIGASGRGAGVISFYKMEEKQLVLANEVQHRVFVTETGSTFRCGTFAASTGHARHLATGIMTLDSDFVYLRDQRDPERLEIPVLSTKGHDLIINAIDGYGPTFTDTKSTELLTGGRDGQVKVWDLRAGLSPTLVVNPGSTAADVWSVAFANSGTMERIFAAGYDNGDVKVFDHRGNSYVWDVNVGSGVCSLEFSAAGTNVVLVAGTLDGFHVIDLTTGKVNSNKLNSTVWKVRHVPQRPSYYMTATGDGSLSLYQQGLGSKANLKQTEHPIVSFDWNGSKEGLYAAVSLYDNLTFMYSQNFAVLKRNNPIYDHRIIFPNIINKMGRIKHQPESVIKCGGCYKELASLMEHFPQKEFWDVNLKFPASLQVSMSKMVGSWKICSSVLHFVYSLTLKSLLAGFPGIRPKFWGHDFQDIKWAGCASSNDAAGGCCAKHVETQNFMTVFKVAMSRHQVSAQMLSRF